LLIKGLLNSSVFMVNVFCAIFLNDKKVLLTERSSEDKVTHKF